MNINNVYVASVWMLVDIEITKSISLLDFEYRTHSVYLKDTLIYYKDGYYYYLETNKKCKTEVSFLDNSGTQFIMLNKKLIPVVSIIDYKRENMSKRRILKKYNEVKNGGRK